MTWAIVSSWSWFCWLYRASLSLAAKDIINLISVLTIWWCPGAESSFVLLEEGVCYDQCVLLAKHSQSYGFSGSHVWMWELDYKESWALKNWCFWWCWRRLLRVPWTARRSNQSILKEISPEYPLAGLMLKLKLQYFGHLMRRADSFEKTLMVGKIEGRRRRGWQRTQWLDGITD